MNISGARPCQETSVVILQIYPEFLGNPRAKWQELRPRASDLLDFGSTEAPRRGWERSRSHWHSRARRFPASAATAASSWLHRVPPHSPGTESVPTSTGAALLQAIRQRKAIYRRWKHCVLKHSAKAALLPQGLGTLWLFTLCSATSSLSVPGHWYTHFHNLFPRSDTFNQPDWAHTCGCWMDCWLSQRRTQWHRARKPRTNRRYSPRARQHHHFGRQFGSVRVQTHPFIGCRWCHGRALIPGDCRFNITRVTPSSASDNDHAPWRKLLEQRTKQLVETVKVSSLKCFFPAFLLSKWSCWGHTCLAERSGWC